MKKIFLFMLTAGIALYACKKDDNGDNPPTQEQEVNTENPDEMTAAVKVFHATNVQGTLPVQAGGNGPRLDEASNNQAIQAVDGRYAVISPTVTSGAVSGYYLKLSGASSYFKLDYSRPMTGRKKPAGKRGNFLRELDDNRDSSIVIQLPANAKPGTFCVEYAAYDSVNNVSNPIKVCITIIPAGADAAGKTLAGTWTTSRIKEGNGEWRDYFAPDSTFNEFRCVNDSLRYCFQGETGCFSLASSITKRESDELILSDNGTYTYNWADKYFSLPVFNYEKKISCTNPEYEVSAESDSEIGGWSYNSGTQKLTVVFDFDGSIADYDTYTVSVTELTGTRMVLKDVEYNEFYEFVKK